MAEIAPTRSRTDPLAPEDNRRSTQSHHSRLRATSFRKEHPHRHRHLAKETVQSVQSAIELKPPITFDHLLRRDKRDRDSDSSRRASSNPQATQQQQLDGAASGRPSQKRITLADVERAREENRLREEDLRSSLKNVEEVGMSSTRQLDDTYYAILEKASILRSTVNSLQQLVDESREMHTSFQEDTIKLERDTKQTAQGFGDFKQQETKINDLVGKLQASRDRTEALNGRLESARLRVEAYEERENTTSARRRARFNLTGATLLGVLVLVVAVLLTKHRRLVEMQLDTVSEHLLDVVGPVSSRLKASPTEDPYLKKLFDEL